GWVTPSNLVLMGTVFAPMHGFGGQSFSQVGLKSVFTPIRAVGLFAEGETGSAILRGAEQYVMTSEATAVSSSSWLAKLNPFAMPQAIQAAQAARLAEYAAAGIDY